MSHYVDTSVLAKLYVAEKDSAAAITLVTRLRGTKHVTALHRLELENALQLKVFRTELDRTTAMKAFAAFESDIAAEFWHLGNLLDDAWVRAEALAQNQTAVFGTRALDVLHVASSVALGARTFVTNDDRQARLAAQVGLRLRTL